VRTVAGSRYPGSDRLSSDSTVRLSQRIVRAIRIHLR
jgi:hypothetical protein